MSSKISIALVALACLGTMAHAQTAKPKASLNAEISSQFSDNNSGAITPQILRNVTQDMVASSQQYAAVNAQVGTTYTIAATDYGQLVTFNNVSPVAVSLPGAATLNPFNFFVSNLGAGLVTITPAIGTINGAATFAVSSGVSAWVVSDGTNYQVFKGFGSGAVNSGTAGQLAWYASSGSTVSGNANLNVSNGSLTLGQIGVQQGALALSGGTSGSLTIAPQAVAGTPTWTAGTSNGTPAVTASAPLAITAATGNITCATCVTSAGSLTANQIIIGSGSQGEQALGSLGTTTTVLHGNAGGAPTFGAVANADLANSSVTYGTTTVALGASSTAIAGLTSVGLTSGSTVNWNSDTFLGRLGAANLQLGAANSATPTAQTLSVQNATGTNTAAAASLTIVGPLSTGTGTDGDIILQTGIKTTTGSTGATPTTAVTIKGETQLATFTGPALSTGTTAPSLANGNGLLYASSTNGGLHSGKGSVNDVSLVNSAGATAANVPTGTTNFNVVSTLTFGILSPTSLGASPTTVSGLTINNTPNSSNDYIPYFSAADGAIRRCTVGSCASAATAGVSALNGLVGSLSLVPGIGASVSSVGTTVTVGVSLTTISSILGSNPALNNSTFTDGPSVAQGGTGVFDCSGTATFSDSAGAAFVILKMYDGTNNYAATVTGAIAATANQTATLQAFATNPAGNMRLAAKSATNTSSFRFNDSGTSKDTQINCKRIG